MANGWPLLSKAVLKDWSLRRPMVPPALNGDQQAELKAAVQELPAQAGSDLSELISAALQMWIPHWLQFRSG